MKICHFSDSHLGAGVAHPRRGSSGLTLRQEDILNSFTETVERIIKIKPDLCLHSGDLFDNVRPLNSIIAVAAEQFHRLASENKIRTVLITGNHDAPKQPHIGAAVDILRTIENLFVASGTGLKRFDFEQVRCFALPHCLTTQIQKDELQKCRPNPDFKYNIIIAHGVAAGMPEFSMADLGEQELPLEVLNRFDYAALGHFHNHCKVADRAFYAGSAERLSQQEREAAKGFVVVDLDPFKVTFEQIKARAMVDIATIDATGKRGDVVVGLIQAQLDQIDPSDKIVRVKVSGVSEEMLRTIPSDKISTMKQNAYALNIQFEREKSEESMVEVGRSGVGRIDTGFLEFLDSADLTGFDRERMRREAMKYLEEN
jgi:DNA repair exonuclease SbcCD nuclease subunit